MLRASAAAHKLRHGEGKGMLLRACVCMCVCVCVRDGCFVDGFHDIDVVLVCLCDGPLVHRTALFGHGLCAGRKERGGVCEARG